MAIFLRFLVLLATAVPIASSYPSQRTNNYENRPHYIREQPPYPSATSTGNATTPEILRGVNVGSWLILEKWMVNELFNGTNATDQHSFDSTPGAESKLNSHWETYFTEEDVKKIASWGINALRIPIGFWAYEITTPYIKGADQYMEKAIGWARKHGLKVLVDCHGSPGSQNGFDNSGQAGKVLWQSGDNLNKSISVLQTMAGKYGAKEYADVVFGIELTNEPISWDNNNLDVTKEWTREAYHAVEAAATNKELMIVMHDSFATPFSWLDVGASLNGNASKTEAKFAIDTHLYQNQDKEYSCLTQDQHIEKACKWSSTNLLPANETLPVYVGEFSSLTNICVYPNATITAGGADNSCDVDGCLCSANTEPQYYSDTLRDATRKFLEAELDAFEHSAKGWFIWSYQGPGAWGLDNLIKYNVLGQMVTDRKFPNQCGFASS